MPLTDFFSHKIHSGPKIWPERLCEIVHILKQHEDEEFDLSLRKQLIDDLRTIAPRISGSRTGVAYRDEITAYPAYLGVCRFQRTSQKRWAIKITKTAQRFLLSEAPDVAAFLRLQLPLLQYPNGVGVNHRHGRVQANAKSKTWEFVHARMHVSPVRLLALALQADAALREIDNLSEAEITAPEVYTLANHPDIFHDIVPPLEVVKKTLLDIRARKISTITGEKRFHLLNHTQVFNAHVGKIKFRSANSGPDLKILEAHIKAIVGIDSKFEEFDNCKSEDELEEIILGDAWGNYFDALSHLPEATVQVLVTDTVETSTPELLSGTQKKAAPLREFNKNERPYTVPKDSERTGVSADPEVTQIKKERRNVSHALLVSRLLEWLEDSVGVKAIGNSLHIDLWAKLPDGRTFIFEVKSGGEGISEQIRKAVSQLHEYRYRYSSELPDAHICLVLPDEPPVEWISHYLCRDRNINVCIIPVDETAKFHPLCQQIIRAKPSTTDKADERRHLANAVRALAMDAVQAAKSGHPGMPMGMADIAEVLWNDFLRHNPSDPGFVDRDRFVLSNGHGSMLLYALLHLSGYDLALDELRNFRQLHSQTPGHPEYGDTPGVETTTGPLGQGIANAVGMALSEKILGARFNRDGHSIVDHHTYVFLGDGCLMEGISHEACGLAGHLRLGKLIGFYDDNNISIDGEVRRWFSDDTAARFRAYGWHVVDAVDGHDADAVSDAIKKARAEKNAPSLIVCKTVIGFGAPNKAGTESSHGAPLGEEEVALARKKLNWTEAPFVIPDEVYRAWDARERGAKLQEEWREKFKQYRAKFPDDAAEFERRVVGELPTAWNVAAKKFIAQTAAQEETVATRQASQNTLENYAPQLPELIGGSADLTGSNLTLWSGSQTLGAQSDSGDGDDGNANYIYYGVREFAMCAVMNGIALHGGFIPYGGTFLMFSEYARNALRMAALMGVRAIFVFTHDSIGLGEDGPTHQAVEQAASLRLMPNMSLWRPCDAVETAVAWRAAIERKNAPTSLLLSRQNLAHQKRDNAQLANIARGGYVLSDCAGAPEIILIATGSEVALAMAAADAFTKKDRKVRVVSMPSVDVFESQDAAYRAEVLPPKVRNRIAVEAGVTDGWRKYVGLDGAVLGMDTFGASAPAADVFRHFGFTVENLSAMMEAMLAE